MKKRRKERERENGLPKALVCELCHGKRTKWGLRGAFQFSKCLPKASEQIKKLMTLVKQGFQTKQQMEKFTNA
jgi:hypothetical protein